MGMKSLIALTYLIDNNKTVKSLIFLSLIFNFANGSEIDKFFQKHWKLSDKSIKMLKNKEILSDAQVETKGETQFFIMQGAALHNKKCSIVLKRLSKLEKLDEYIEFIKRSDYNEKAKLLTIRAEHTILPYPMLVYIFVDRPTKQGKYPFKFPSGIFTGLSGEFFVKEVEGRCALYVHSFWRGKKTNLPNFVIELFSETLARIGGEVLIRKSQY